MVWRIEEFAEISHRVGALEAPAFICAWNQELRAFDRWSEALNKSLDPAKKNPWALRDWLDRIGADERQFFHYWQAAQRDAERFKAFLADQKSLNVPLIECVMTTQAHDRTKIEALGVAVGYTRNDWEEFLDYLGIPDGST